MLFLLGQTCEQNTSCVFSVTLPDLVHDLDICSDVFSVPPQEVYERVAFTNAYYGGSTPKGSRIVFVNGKEYTVTFTAYHKISRLSLLAGRTETLGTRLGKYSYCDNHVFCDYCDFSKIC